MRDGFCQTLGDVRWLFGFVCYAELLIARQRGSAQTRSDL